MERRARAEAKLKSAGQVLAELELLDRWRAYGDPEVVGSVGLALVVRPDIDLEIYADEPSAADGFAVVTPLAGRRGVRRMRFTDARDQREQGLYWRIDYELTPDETWTIDMWLFPRRLRAQDAPTLADICAALTADTRDAILAIKEEAATRNTRAHGHWVYRAVLNEGVRSYDEYQAWMGHQDVWERTAWEPKRH